MYKKEKHCYNVSMKILPSSLHIGVIRGGPSDEYDASLQSGGAILKSLSKTHNPLDIFISKDGTWHIQGIERSPERILKNVDVVWNALHGAYGEDGGVQDILQSHGVPHTGSRRYESAIALNKLMAKDHANALGIKTPVAMLVSKTDSLKEKAKEIWNSIPRPLMIKPVRGGSFVNIPADSLAELLSSLDSVLSATDSAIVEEQISGKDVSCMVTDGFRDQKSYTFPPVIHGSSTLKLSKNEIKTVEEIARDIHNILKLSHVSQSNFVVAPKRGVYFIDVSTSPKFGADTVGEESLKSVGADTTDFLHHVLGLALERRVTIR